MSGLVFNSLVCLMIAAGPAKAATQSRNNGPIVFSVLPDAVGHDVFTWVEPGKDPLVIGQGRSRLLHFPVRIRRSQCPMQR